MLFARFFQLAALCSVALSLPTVEHLQARDCSAEIEALNLERRAKRGLSKRTFYSGMLNTTCLLTPEATREDWATSSVRSNIVDSQPGVSLLLDIGVLDVTTCKPLPNAMVELWGPNAQGNYGSFLRGAFASASNGIAEFQTIFPGFATGGANHLNIAVHGGSLSSATAHVGQLFFTDRWTDVVSAYGPYVGNTNSRMKNAQDPNFVTASKAGYNAIIDIEDINDDWPEGVVGYITVGVNPKAVSKM